MLADFLRPLRPVDALICCFALILSIIILLNFGTIAAAPTVILINIFISLGIITVANINARNERSALSFVHDWYPAPMIFLTFKEIHVIIQSLNLRDHDAILISADRWMFGTDPTVWLRRFSTPPLTELMQIGYASYFFLMLAVAVELWRSNSHERFSIYVFTLVYGFYLSYVGYLLFPAIGPRFTLHNFASMNSELPGIFATEWIRNFLNAAESIPADAATAWKFAQRDAFPSGHTQMTLIALYFAFKYSLRSRYVLTFFGMLVIIATMYLRYHYVVDVLFGVVFTVITIWSADYFFNRERRRSAATP